MEHTTKRPLVLSTPPHVFDGITTQKVMLNVVIALVPTLIASFVIFGWRALLVTAVTTAACVLFEYLWCLLRKTPQTAGDLSAVVTGLLLAFNLPSTIPLYMAVIGSFVAIVVVKELFGGIGRNFANPAIVARIVLSVSFTAAMTNYAAPQGFLPGATGVDAVSSATPLAPGAAQLPFMDLLFGVHPGVLGETCGIAILLGFAWLLVTRTVTFTIPGVYVGTVIVCSLLTGHDVATQVFSGGLLLCAVFMATDYTTSPTTFKGQVIFAVGLGLITCLIRFWGNMNEGAAYSILLMNLVVPYIAPTLWNSLVKPAVVLVLICAIVGFLLGSVDNLTLPTITANREARAWATYNALIPEATDFEALPCDVPGVTACMEATDDLGYAVIAQSKGYSSQVPMAVAFDDEGTITNVIGMDNTETPGLGTKVQLPDFTDQFLGRTAEPLTIDDIDAVTGATISSKAALAAVNEAIEAYRSAAGEAPAAAATSTEKGAA